jgi:hypothetical protein
MHAINNLISHYLFFVKRPPGLLFVASLQDLNFDFLLDVFPFIFSLKFELGESIKQPFFVPLSRFKNYHLYLKILQHPYKPMKSMYTIP